MNKTKNTNETSTTRSLLHLTLAVALAATLGACEDLPAPPSKAKSSVTEAPPEPRAVAPTPPPVAATEVKPEPDKTEDDTTRVDTLTAARKLLGEGEVDKGLALANLAVKETPKRSAAWNVLGRAQLRKGKLDGAIASFKTAIELNPSNSYAHNNLGLALIYAKKYDEAVDTLEEAVDLTPVTAYMWNNLGMAYEQLDRLDEARDAYDKAAAMESDLARGSLARLKGVESVIRTAKAEPETKGAIEGTSDSTPGATKDKETPTVTQ